MTVELSVNITKPLKYRLIKTRFRLTFLGLAGKICIANFKQNKLPFCYACILFSQENEKHPNEGQQGA